VGILDVSLAEIHGASAPGPDATEMAGMEQLNPILALPIYQ
jgi:hypothetical protein